MPCILLVLVFFLKKPVKGTIKYICQMDISHITHQTSEKYKVSKKHNYLGILLITQNITNNIAHTRNTVHSARDKKQSNFTRNMMSQVNVT